MSDSILAQSCVAVWLKAFGASDIMTARSRSRSRSRTPHWLSTLIRLRNVSVLAALHDDDAVAHAGVPIYDPARGDHPAAEVRSDVGDAGSDVGEVIYDPADDVGQIFTLIFGELIAFYVF